MPTSYFCAHCDEEFVPDNQGQKPRCPKCMRKGGVESVHRPDRSGATRRGVLVGLALVAALAAGGYGIYRSQTVRLEETPPLRPLDSRELTAYLERDQVQVGGFEPMLVLVGDLDGWPAAPDALAAELDRRSSRWSLEQTLPREVMTAESTLGAVAEADARPRLYPLEAATAMAAVLRSQGTRAMVAEVWSFGGDQAPPDPSGMLGYYVTVVYEPGAEEPSAYFDPWGGRGAVAPAEVRVLRDTEVIAAALGLEAVRVFTQSGDGKKALPLVDTALTLDPVSPVLRVVHATVLTESGGVPQAVSELEAAQQLRPDGPRALSLVQLRLANAAMLEANGDRAAAQAEFGDVTRMVADVVEKFPRYGRAHLTLATIHLGLDEPERARVELETAEGLSPDAPMLWAVWAQYHRMVGDDVAASARMRRAVQLDPENWQLRVQAASILWAIGDEAEAKVQADEALRRVSTERREPLRQYLDAMMADIAPPTGLAPPTSMPSTASPDPVMKLGDPSKLRLRDPGDSLQLELDD